MGIMTNTYGIVFLVVIRYVLQVLGETSSFGAECPTSKGLMKRVGNTRYFIFHNPRGKEDVYYDWQSAKKMCSEIKGFKMATIEKQTTFAVVTRALESLVTKHSFLDTWYWLDAKYNKNRQMYFWDGDEARPVSYSNFLYRYPRPTGLAGFVDKYKTYQINKTIEQCLTLALPFPAAYNMKPPEKRGATFDEKPCSAKQTIHAICESTLPACTNTNTDPFSLSEDKDSYFEDGNWWLGNRYLVNWKQVTKPQSEEYCKKYKMTLFNPISKEVNLIPHLKMWSRSFTVSQFWTNWTYNIQQPGNGMKGEFKNALGKTMAHIRAFVNASDLGDLDVSRSNKFDTSLCVAMQVSAEFKKSQYPCPNGYESTCNWNFIQYVPANCNNFHGTICEYSKQLGKLYWKKLWAQNPVELLNTGGFPILRPFGYGSNKNVFRSGIKQTFGSFVCPKGFRMPRLTDTKWHTQRYTYILEGDDFQDSYWVVDEEGFRKNITSTCALSIQSNSDEYARLIKEVPCTEWHFYLCDRQLRPIVQRDYKLPYEIVKSIHWDDNRFERKYPIVE